MSKDYLDKWEERQKQNTEIIDQQQAKTKKMGKEEMIQFIKETLVEMYKNTTTDKYGQVSRDNFIPSLFGDKRDEVDQFCKENKGVLQFATYGGRFGTYKAFTIEDDEIRKDCNVALRSNPNYIHNMTS